MARPHVWSRRNLENVTRTRDQITITGWTFAPEAGRLETLAVRVSPPEAARPTGVELLDSDDVVAAFPGAPEARGCRFKASFELPVEVSRSGVDSRSSAPFLVVVTPAFEKGAGQTWCIGIDLPGPPADLVRRVGGGAEVGLEFLGYFIDAGLIESDTVLDLGCGTGRMALPLRYFLGDSARYVGIDVDARLVAWCQENVEAVDSRFRFSHLAARNDLYNPRTNVDVTETRLPIQDATIDFAFATSVFTHLRPMHVRHSMSELARVLRADARLFVTAFLIDEKGGSGARPEMCFVEAPGGFWTTELSLPETAIGYELETLRRWGSERRLRLDTVLSGTWSGIRRGHSFQDILVFTKLAASRSAP